MLEMFLIFSVMEHVELFFFFFLGGGGGGRDATILLYVHCLSDYSVTAKYVAQSATRALGLLIISYGAAIRGIKEYSTINTVQHKAWRFFLGVGRYTPNATVNGDTCMGWMPPHIKQLKTVLCHWFSLNHMDDKRVNKHVFQWSYSTRQKYINWCLHLERMMKKFDHCPDIGNVYIKSERQSVIKSLQDNMFNEYKNKWLENINSNISISKNNGDTKLHTYKLFKRTYETEQYVKNHIISRTKRSAIAKFRCGVAPFVLKLVVMKYCLLIKDIASIVNLK